MGLAKSVHHFLESRGVTYDVVSHAPTEHSFATARASRVPEDNLAKGILIRSPRGFLLAVLPASRRVELAELGDWLEQPVELASEDDVTMIFSDCAPGSVPPVAGAYGLAGVVDESLEGFENIYFEGGDHSTLVHVSGREFHRLMAGLPHAQFGASIH